MQRSITVSTDVFAAIWAKRQEGENTEDEILRRIFGCGVKAEPIGEPIVPAMEGGVYDNRNDVHFPEGFEIFRMYKRREYAAIARSGFWVRKDNARRFPTLNQLNESIAAGSENVWNGSWKYRAQDGSIRSIAELRR